MSDISDLENRITAALDRIGGGLESLAPKPDVGAIDEIARLKQALEDEKTANSQLEERVKAIKEKQEGTLANMAEEVERLRAQVETGDAGVTQLRKVNGELRVNNLALRDAVSAGIAEPHLVNKSMMAELEALRAAQAADRAELDAVLGELEPMLTPSVSEENADA